MPKSSAEIFIDTIRANVENEKLTDEEFRDFIRNSLPVLGFFSEGDKK